MRPGHRRPGARLGGLLVTLLVLVAGCALTAQPGSSDLVAGVPRFTDEVTPAPVTAEPLGSVQFAVDPARKAIGVFDSRKAEQKLTLTDQAGFTWTLTVPAQALGGERTLTMTALIPATGSGLPGKLASGVQLEPIGLRFDRPATLSVTGRTLTQAAIILGGDHDGANLRFSLGNRVSSGAASRITHFSTYFVDDLDTAQVTALAALAAQQYQALSRQAGALLSDPDIVVPRPPAARPDCPDPLDAEASGLALTKFEHTFLDPEDSLIGDLLAAQTGRELLGDTATPDRTAVLGLLGRQVLKANLLIDQYGSDLERLPALAGVVLRVGLESGLLGVPDAGSATLTTKVGAMYEKTLGRLFDRLVNQHQYWTIQTILDSERVLSVVTGQAQQALRNRLQDALHFDLQLTFNLNQSSTRHWVVQARLPLQYDVASGRLSGAGVGTVVSYVADNWTVRMVAPDFTVRAAAYDMKPCAGTAKVELDQFFPVSETYSDKSGSQTRALVKMGWQGIFEKYATGGGYEFPVSVRGNDAVAIDMGVVGGPSVQSGVDVDGTLQIRLTHTPRAG